MARSFNGTSDLVTLNTGGTVTYLPNTAVVSFAAWVNTGATAGTIFGCDTGSAPNRFAQWKIVSAKLNLVMFNATVARTWVGTTSVNTSTWVHVGASYDGTTGKLWVNGVAEGSAALVATNGSDTHSWRIGSQLVGVTNSFFNGKIAEAGWWKRALSANEFLSLANGLPASHLGPDHYLPLWGGDSPEPDLGGQTHALGTLTGTTAANPARVGLELVTFR